MLEVDSMYPNLLMAKMLEPLSTAWAKVLIRAMLILSGWTPTESWEIFGFLSLLFPFGLAIFRSGLAQRKNTMIILASPFIHLAMGKSFSNPCIIS